MISYKAFLTKDRTKIINHDKIKYTDNLS